MTVKILCIAHVIEGLEQTWLQHMRDFDTAHPGCHFEIVFSAPDLTMEQLVAKMQIDPPLDVGAILKREPSTGRDRLAALTEEDRALLAEALQPQMGGTDAHRLVDLLIEIALAKHN